MSLVYDVDTLTIILTQLVDEMGGVATIDVSLLLYNLKSERLKNLEIKVVENKLILEVHDESEIAE